MKSLGRILFTLVFLFTHLVAPQASQASALDSESTEFAKNLVLVSEKSPRLLELLRHTNLSNGRANQFIKENKEAQVANIASYFKGSNNLEKEFHLIIDKISSDFISDQKDETVVYDNTDLVVMRADLVLLALAKSDAKRMSASHLMALRIILGLDTEEEIKRAEEQLAGMDTDLAENSDVSEGLSSNAESTDNSTIIIYDKNKADDYILEGNKTVDEKKEKLERLRKSAFENIELGLAKLDKAISEENPILTLIESELTHLSVLNVKLRTRLFAYAISDFISNSKDHAGENSFQFMVSLVGEEKAHAVVDVIVGLKAKGIDLVAEMKNDPVFAGKLAFNFAGLLLSFKARSVIGITLGLWSFGKVIIKRIPTSKLIFKSTVILNKVRAKLLENESLRSKYMRVEAEVADFELFKQETIIYIKETMVEKATVVRNCAAQLTKDMGENFNKLKGLFQPKGDK